MLLPDPQHFPKFLEFSPDDLDFTCIFPLPSAHFRRCSKLVNKNDRQSALALREQICALGPLGDNLEERLRSYAQLCCCIRYHRTQLSDLALLNELCCLWKKQLRPARPVEGQETVHTVAVTADAIERAITDVVRPVTESLQRGPTTSTNAHHPSPGGAPETVDHVPIAQKKDSPGPNNADRSSSPIAGRQDHARESIAHAQKTDTLPPILPPTQAPPPAPATVQVRRVVTRSQTGSLPWSFTPRRPPAEKTMLKLLTDPISEYSSQTGYLYAYARVSDPGFAKVGCTTRPKDVRLKEWEKSCGYKPILLYSTGPVPNVRRLESLVKKDLNLGGRGRQETYCKHNKYCPRNHSEWFEVSVREVMLLVDAWVAWMQDALPYRSIAKADCKNPPVAVLQDEWRRHFVSMSRRQVEIRSSCLEWHIRPPRVAVTTVAATDKPEAAEEDAEPDDRASQATVVRRPLADISTNTMRRAVLERRSRESPDEADDEADNEAGTSSNGSLLVDHGSLDPKMAAAFALAAEALCKSFGVDQAAPLSTVFNAGSLTTSILEGAGVSRPTLHRGKEPLRPILAC